MSDFYDFDEYEEEPYYCHICEAECYRVDCWNCGGTGGFDGEKLMEEDPLWYDEDDWEDCHICDGQGDWWQCPNEDNHPHVVARDAASSGMEEV